LSDSLKYNIHNCHAHVFTVDHIPKYFLHPLVPVGIARKKWMERMVRIAAKFRDDRLYAFLFAARRCEQKEIFLELQKYYPTSARYALLSIDFDYMGRGKPQKPFLTQIEELHALAKEVNEKEQFIYPFIGVDPRRSGIENIVKKYIEEKGFTGIKLYPALGFFPDDPKLYPIYKYAQENEIPITTHCLPKNKNHFSGKISQIWKDKVKEIQGYDFEQTLKPYDFAQYLLHPHWYRKVLEDFPKLKINLGHFGGEGEWNKYLDATHEPDNESKPKAENWYWLIRDLLKDFENTYADISFTVHDAKLYPLLKNVILSNYSRSKKGHPPFSLTEKVLFGTDFYMMQKDYNERRFGIDVRGYLSDELYWQIAETNPKKFLKNKFSN